MAEPVPLVIATGNAGKMREIAAILRDPLVEFVHEPRLQMATVEETAPTFVENALLKARYAAGIAGVAALGDDSGLEVDALDGAPGILSARYAGDDASDSDNVAKLLRALADVDPVRRTARFRCAIVVVRRVRDPAPLICQGCWEGHIALEPTGDRGFGYDPVFIPAGLARSAADLPPEEKNRLSHRGQALAAARSDLAEFLRRRR
jgi:XTP/dITP diphosphohydrolase